jgi:hypothetical protein
LYGEDEERTDFEAFTLRTRSAIVEALLNTGILHEGCQSVEGIVVVVHVGRINFEILCHFEENVAEFLSTAVPSLHSFLELLQNDLIV